MAFINKRTRVNCVSQIAQALNENPIFNKIGSTARIELARCGFIKSFEPNTVIVSEGTSTSHMYLIETGMLSLQVNIDKDKLETSSIESELKPLFKQLSPKTRLQVFEKGELKRNRRSYLRIRNSF